MQFLHPGTDFGRNQPFRIGQPLELASTPTGQNHRAHASRLRLLQGKDQVGRIATGGEEDEDISRSAKRFDLAGKNPIEAEIVADAGQGRSIGGKADGGQGAAVILIATDQFLA